MALTFLMEASDAATDNPLMQKLAAWVAQAVTPAAVLRSRVRQQQPLGRYPALPSSHHLRQQHRQPDPRPQLTVNAQPKPTLTSKRAPVRCCTDHSFTAQTAGKLASSSKGWDAAPSNSTLVFAARALGRCRWQRRSIHPRRPAAVPHLQGAVGAAGGAAGAGRRQWRRWPEGCGGRCGTRQDRLPGGPGCVVAVRLDGVTYRQVIAVACPQPHCRCGCSNRCLAAALTDLKGIHVRSISATVQFTYSPYRTVAANWPIPACH